jgi:hypothetical protein
VQKKVRHCCDGAPPLFIFTRHLSYQLNLLITAKALSFILAEYNQLRFDSFDIMSRAAAAVLPITFDWITHHFCSHTMEQRRKSPFIIIGVRRDEDLSLLRDVY